MPSAATIFNYCERGLNPSFWAEPLNAVTNGGFIVAAIAGAAMILRQPARERSLWHVFFVLNFIAIGVGSFLFHTVPNVRTELADTGPIGVFMLTYLTYSLRRFVRLPWLGVIAGLAIFIAAMVMSFKMKCWNGEMGFELEVPVGGRAECMNGSLSYFPALVAKVLIAGWLLYKRHPAGRLILAASAVFIVSITLRSLDQRLCSDIVLFGHRIGTHFLWHLLNSLTLFLLLTAAIKYGGRGQEVLPPRPEPRRAVYGASEHA
jgi:hypothetical protein